MSAAIIRAAENSETIILPEMAGISLRATLMGSKQCSTLKNVEQIIERLFTEEAPAISLGSFIVFYSISGITPEHVRYNVIRQ
jgi:hypothetical protein